MKFKVYSNVKGRKIEEALDYAVDYFNPLTVEFSSVKYTKEQFKKDSFYDTVLSWSMNLLKPTKSISAEYLATLDHTGYDGVVLFVNKMKAKADGDLYGQHSVKDGVSYIEVYCTPYFYENTTKYEGYTKNGANALRTQIQQTLLHELFHAYSYKQNIRDQLHTYIEEGNFEKYHQYLQNKILKVPALELYKLTLSLVGTDVTPLDEVPDTVACAVTVSTLIQRITGDFPVIAGTYTLNEKMKADNRFIALTEPEEGAILMYATGTGNGKLKNGHVFICGKNEGLNTLLYSNDSYSGLLKQNYTLATARQRYVDIGGFKECFYKLQ